MHMIDHVDMQAVKIVSKERHCNVYAYNLSHLLVTKHCSALWLSGYWQCRSVEASNMSCIT
jgi:hypothetical protein